MGQEEQKLGRLDPSAPVERNARLLVFPKGGFNPRYFAQCDSFYDINKRDIKVLMQSMKESKWKWRKRETQRKRLKDYHRTVIRVKLSEEEYLEGHFKATDTIGHLKRFVNECLGNKGDRGRFTLYITPPKQLLQVAHATFRKLQLVPAAIVYMLPDKGSGFEPQVKKSLRAAQLKFQARAMKDNVINQGKVEPKAPIPKVDEARERLLMGRPVEVDTGFMGVRRGVVTGLLPDSDTEKGKVMVDFEGRFKGEYPEESLGFLDETAQPPAPPAEDPATVPVDPVGDGLDEFF